MDIFMIKKLRLILSLLIFSVGIQKPTQAQDTPPF